MCETKKDVRAFLPSLPSRRFLGIEDHSLELDEKPKSPLLAILYSEFDNITGPKLVYQAPQNFVSPTDFGEVSAFMIQDAVEFLHKIVTIIAFGYKWVGYPMSIGHRKYGRHRFSFNLAFLFDKDTETEPYHPVLCKFANMLETLELESKYLWRQETKCKVEELLVKTLYQINKFGESNVYADPSNQICLKLFPKLPSVNEVKAYEVPVRLRNLDSLITNEWDLTIRQVVPYIDNVAYVQRIAARSGVDLPLVERCLRQLRYYRCITMIDIFQYSNVYTPTEGIGELYRKPWLQESCVQYVAKLKPPNGLLPPWKTIFRLYTRFQRGLRLSEYCKEQKIENLNVDIRKLVTFGVLNKLIRRVHKYPTGKEGLVDIRLTTVPLSATSTYRALLNPITGYSVTNNGTSQVESPQHSPYLQSTASSLRLSNSPPQGNSSSNSSSSNSGSSKKDTERRGGSLPRSLTDFSVTKLLDDESKTKQRADEEEDFSDLSVLGRMMDGHHSFDEICCTMRMPYAFLERQVRSDERCVIISR